MVNLLIDEYRKNKKYYENIQYVEDYSQVTSNVEINDAIKKMDAERIHKLIMKLPPMSQKVFNLYIIDGYEHKEIAGMLGISEGTSKWHLHNSRERLKTMLLETAEY